MELHKRIADIEAATFITDLIAGNPVITVGEISLSISDGATLLLKQVSLANDNSSTPMDWSLVTRLKVMRVHNVT